MLRITSLFALLAVLFASAQAETIVSDNIGNSITLPLAGGNATGAITNTNARTSTSPYILSVYVNNGQSPGSQPNSKESFWFAPPNNNGRYGNATLVQTAFSATFSTNSLVTNTSAGQYLGTPNRPTNITGLYTFRFSIPVLSSILVNLTYINAGAPQAVVDLISILVTNPAVAVGDPQFIGLRGQSFQVHGIDGAVYNIISEANTQVNSRFVFLSEGSYLGALAFQQIVDGKIHKLLVEAGPAASGFASITMDNKQLSVGDIITFGSFSIKYRSTHIATITTESFSFELSNSDNFLNQAVSNLKPLNKLNSHGLLGQTHAAKVYSTAARYIEGEIDDYVVADNDIFGTDFAYNKFNL